MRFTMEGSAKEIADFIVNLQKPTNSDEFIPCDSNGYRYSQGESMTNPLDK